MKETLEKNKKGILIGVGALLVIVLVVVLWNRNNPKNAEQKKINVKVDIEDENGNTVSYDPNPLLERLNKGLTSWYFWGSSVTTERCGPIGELYDLDAVRFMATVRAYKTKYDVDIQTHMNATYRGCTSLSGKGDYFELIKQRINNLNEIIK